MLHGALLGLVLLVVWLLLFIGRILSALARRVVSLVWLASVLLACDWCAYYGSLRLWGTPHSAFVWPAPNDIFVGALLWAILAMWAWLGLVGSLILSAIRAKNGTRHKDNNGEYQSWAVIQAAVLCGVGGLVVISLCEALLLAQRGI